MVVPSTRSRLGMRLDTSAMVLVPSFTSTITFDTGSYRSGASGLYLPYTWMSWKYLACRVTSQAYYFTSFMNILNGYS